MDRVTSLDALHALYGQPGEAALRKVTPALTPGYRRWIEAARFCILTTVGPEGTDGSPRGDAGAVVTVLDPRTLALPDWRGNNRLDSLRNIVQDGRVSLMFLVPGQTNVIRVNGHAIVTTDTDLRGQFARADGTLPATVIVVTIAEVYTQCARAILRAGLWQGDAGQDLPSVGQLLAEITEGGFDGARYDADWAARAEKTMW